MRRKTSSLSKSVTPSQFTRCPSPYLGFDRIKPIVEKINSLLGRRL